jgi:hypothetical protein
MDIKLIREVVNSSADDGTIEYMIIQILAQDEKVIPTIMDILAAERKKKSKLITEMNMQLSRADIGLGDNELNEDGFMQEEIRKFYAKFKDQVGHCFKDYSKEELKEEKNDTISGI